MILKLIDKLKPRRRRVVHFLHIGKTGGSAIKYVLERHPETEKFSIVCHDHQPSLMDIPAGELAVFCLRDPVSRFISGFYSRKRKGQPRIYFEWNNLERQMFESFDTPNTLVSHFMDKDSDLHPLAVSAVEQGLHFRHYNYWYGDLDYFHSRLAKVLFIGFQESLEEDFIHLKRILGLPPTAELPNGDVEAHRNPRNVDTFLDENCEAALRQLYRKDIEFVTLCRDIMSKRAPVQ